MSSNELTTRIYKAVEIGKDSEPVMIEAQSKTQALLYLASDQFSVTTAKPSEVARHFKAGGEVKNAVPSK